MHKSVFSVVESAIKDLNEELLYASLENVAEQTPVYGGPDSIDSLSLVSLVVDLESRVAEEFGTNVVLSDEKAMSARNSPYSTAGSLTDFIVERIETSNG